MSIVEVMNVAKQCLDGKRHEQAIDVYRDWLQGEANPLAYVAHFNLAVILGDLQRVEQAEAEYRAAIALNPMFIQARLNLGTQLERKGCLEEALAEWRLILPLIQPDSDENRGFLTMAYNNLGRLLENLKRFSEAEAMLKESLLLDSGQVDALTHWVHLRQKQCKWPIYEPFGAVDIEVMMAATSALAMLGLTNDPEVQLLAAQRFVEKKTNLSKQRLSDRRGYGHAKLRIGYFSSDFCAHAVSILMAEVFELHDRSRIDLYGFSWSREDGTPMRARVVKALDNYIPIAGMSDEEAARCIRSHEIDILIDLHGLTAGTRPGVLAYRPAPVQMTYLGFPGTTALPCIDYVIADKFVLPDELAPFFTEKPLYLPRVFQCNDRQRAIGPKPSRTSCGLPENAFVYCAFNNNFKITEGMFKVWMRILARVPQSVLWIVADSFEVRRNLNEAAAAHSVDPSRLIYAERVGPADYLARYQVADLFLDTMPFNAGTTASDALWAGLPLLTCSGKTFASRMAGSLLHAVDLPELVTYSLEEYENKAVSLAADVQRIAQMKSHLQRDAINLPLFDTPKFVRDLENLLEVVACSGGEPAGSKQESHLYQIAYSQESRLAVQSGYLVLDNQKNLRPDWREYWPIRNFLLSHELVENSWYGFFSPKFQAKTGLSHQDVINFVSAAKFDTDVVTFSPQADMGCFFLNVFEQNDVFDPGFIAVAEAFFRHANVSVALPHLIMDSRQIVFSNFFVARPRFWRAWLHLNEILFSLCEGSDTELSQRLNDATSYESVPRKVFLMERMASFMLATDRGWKVQAYNTFQCAWSGTGMNQYRFEAVVSDALKLAMREQGYADYMAAFGRVRDGVFYANSQAKH